MNKYRRLNVGRRGTYVTTGLWIASGLITLGSISLSRIGIAINSVMGILFVVIGIYLYSRGINLSELLQKTYTDRHDRLYTKVVRGEIILTMIILCIGVILISAVSSRVFGEGFAVFG